MKRVTVLDSEVLRVERGNAKKRIPFDFYPGDVIGEWTIIERNRDDNGRKVYRARCSCGTEAILKYSKIRQNKNLMCSYCIDKAFRLARKKNKRRPFFREGC